MTVKSLTVPRSSLISAAFRVLQVRDACGLVCLMRREIGTLGRLYARPFLLVTKTARRGRVRGSASLRTWTTKGKL